MSKNRAITFSVVERIQVLNILGGVRGSFMTMRLIAEMIDCVDFSAADREELELVTEDSQTHWNPAKADEFEITVELVPSLYGVLRDRFEELDEEEAIDLSILPLTEKIFDAKESGGPSK